MKLNEPKIDIFTEKAKLAADSPQTIDVLLRIVPPETANKAARRPKLNLSIVLDRSGSMQGGKMREAREAAKFCIDQLLSSDRISTVIFDDTVEVLIPSQRAENKESLCRAIDSVHSGGSTALHEAWVKGGLQVSEHLDDKAINRVLLITDGQANSGETRVDRIVSQAGGLAARGVSTSTIGIGRDFNEELLLPMAEAGQGNAWHVKEPGDMQDIFDVELKGLISQIGHSVTLGLRPKNGVRVAEVLNDFEQDGSGRYKLPNLRAGSPLEIVIRLQVPAVRSGETLQLADIDLSFIGQESRLPERVETEFKVEFAPADVVAALEEDTDVLRAVRLLMNARARREAVEHIDRRDFVHAKSALAMAAQATNVLQSVAPSPQLLKDLVDLEAIDRAIDEDDVMARKFSRYQQYSRRTGRER